MRACDNPFSTDRVQGVRYRPVGATWKDLLSRLDALDFRAAIVGPKGTGKTTLLEDLAPRLRSLGFTPKPLRLDEEHRVFPDGFLPNFFADLGSRDIILLDGAEQLPRWHWWRFRRWSREGRGLIVTAHRPGLLPVLIECRTTPELLDGVLTELLGEVGPELRERGRRLFQQHRGNLREVLRSLYDDFARRPEGADIA
ncbi:MAG: hypothetical protein HZA90_12910 [Verrucomicrobia bacterium]|nr:hypothetical protein [Verrucomicrobiota bacterium]